MWPHASSSQRKTCPPSADVRQRSMALITLQLIKAYVAAVGITPRGTVFAEDFRDL